LLEETGIVEIGYTQDLTEQLVEIDENINMENMHANQEKVNEVGALINPIEFFGSYFLEYIKQQFGKYGLKQEYLAYCLECLKTLMLGEDAVGKQNIFTGKGHRYTY
jgi:hypothetical protein